MASSTTLMPVKEYIQRFVEGGEKPACEYLDGILLPKGMGSRDHGRVQRRLLRLLEKFQQFEAIPELHSRIREGEFRIPDVVVERIPVSEDDYPAKPVYLCIEIVSPDQSDDQLLEKCEHYHAWGTPYCWVINPETKKLWEYHKGTERRQLDHDAPFIAAGEIQLSVSAIFNG
jgi:Uma2 family endonuclease